MWYRMGPGELRVGWQERGGVSFKGMWWVVVVTT